MKKIFIILVVAVCICGCNNGNVNKSGILGHEEAVKLVDKGAVIIDVRTEEEYNENHIENAILMTLSTIDKETAEKNIESKDSIVIVYCKSGTRSKQAQEILNDLGYINVYDLGSIDNWQD